MRKFWSYVTNGQYDVRCTGQTVYLYDNAGTELAKFKDITYGYIAVFSPVNSTFVVKSTAGYFAVYSAEQRVLLRKWKFSKGNYGQHEGFCFSPDGKYLINIEHHQSSCNSCISIYETENYTRIAMMYNDDPIIEPSHVEYGSDNVPYVLGFIRGEDGVMKDGFVAKLGKQGLNEIRTIHDDRYKNVYNFYLYFKDLELSGFTEKSKNWSGLQYMNVDMTGIENKSFPLKTLWEGSQ